MLRWLSITAVALMLAADANAGILEDAEAARARGELDLAAKLAEAAALQGIAEAQVLVGDAKKIGNPAEAVKWYRLAADQGNAEAQFKLAELHYGGLGVPKDYDEGDKWLRLSADHGWAEAQVALGNFYEHGAIGPKNFVQAHMWFNLAVSSASTVSRQSPSLQQRQAESVKRQAEGARDRLANHMTPAQLAEAYRLAREWKPTK
jgi:uncharacterized protein